MSKSPLPVHDMGLPALADSLVGNLLRDEILKVALATAKECAGIGSMSVSWWLQQVHRGQAPQPVMSKHRLTRWRLTEVQQFWASFGQAGEN